jgi:hypothetical protein
MKLNKELGRIQWQLLKARLCDMGKSRGSRVSIHITFDGKNHEKTLSWYRLCAVRNLVELCAVLLFGSFLP